MHAAAANGFYDIKHFFTIGKHVKHRRQLSYILCKGAKPNQMAVDAEQAYAC